MKRKLDNKSIETKYEKLMELEKGQKTKKQIADQYGLAKSTLAIWVKKSDDIKNSYLNGDFTSKRKKLRTAGYPEVEEALLTWFKSTRDNNVPISGPFIMSKAEEFACRSSKCKTEVQTEARDFRLTCLLRGNICGHQQRCNGRVAKDSLHAFESI